MASALELDFIEKALSILNSHRSFACKFVLKAEQETAVKELLKGKDVLAVLPTGFGKSVIFIVYLLARSSFVKQTEVSRQISVLVVSPLKSIIGDQILELSSFNCSAIELSRETIHQISTSPPQFTSIYCSAENVMDKDFLVILKDDNSELHKSVEAIVVDESHTIETWTGKRNLKGKSSKSKNKKAFREAYGKLAVLKSMCKTGKQFLFCLYHFTFHQKTLIIIQLVHMYIHHISNTIKRCALAVKVLLGIGH